MFQRIKNNYAIVSECSNDQHTEKYSFTISYDDDWGTVAERHFYDAFGVKPTRINLLSRKKL